MSAIRVETEGPPVLSGDAFTSSLSLSVQRCSLLGPHWGPQKHLPPCGVGWGGRGPDLGPGDLLTHSVTLHCILQALLLKARPHQQRWRHLDTC